MSCRVNRYYHLLTTDVDIVRSCLRLQQLVNFRYNKSLTLDEVLLIAVDYALNKFESEE